MNDISIGTGNLAGKGVYASRHFSEGEVVIRYNLKSLSQDEFEVLPESEQIFAHKHWGQIYLYSEPERYVNHSSRPNTHPDLKQQADIAIKDIEKDEMMTTNAKLDDIS